MVLIDAQVTGLQQFRTGVRNLRSIEKKVNKRVNKGIISIPSAKYVELKQLYKRSPTNLANITEEIEASSSTITEQAIIFNEGIRNKRMIGSVRTTGQSVNTVLRKFQSQGNTVFVSLPSISNTKVLAFKPKPGDLVVTKDGRGKNLYNVSLSSRAVKRVAKDFADSVGKLLEKEASGDFLETRKTHGLQFEIATKIGVSADSIHIVPSLSGTDLTAKVRRQVRKNMSKSNTLMSYSRSVAMKKLTNRTDGFVQSIRNVRVKDKTAIGYTLDNQDKYGIHEKPAGTVTTIRPTSSKVLVFTNLKTGEKVFTRQVRVRARPVIKRSIREVATKLFGRRFNIEKD